MKWNVKDIAFLYPPDVFTGTFNNEKMQERHEREVEKKLSVLTSALAEEKDPLKAMNILHKKDQLQFLLNNKAAFTLAGIFEEALLALYSKENSPFLSGGDALLWNELFLGCNRSILASLSDELPFDSGTVYRGSISGFNRSLCWTTGKKNVDYLKDRWSDSSFSGGDLFEVDVQKSDVLYYRADLREDFLLVSPDFIATANIRNYQG